MYNLYINTTVVNLYDFILAEVMERYDVLCPKKFGLPYPKEIALPSRLAQPFDPEDRVDHIQV
jgi:hypothetical protein